MNVVFARRAAPSIYSAVLLAFIVLAFVLQASFVVGLASGNPAGVRPPALVEGGRPAPCVNG